MRNAFAKAVTELAEVDNEIILLSGDIGNRLFDNFKKNFPNRFYNCGVAEANMTGLASGLASTGFVPITYTITPFNTMRCLEQIRVDICYPNLPVIIVGTGAGLSYSSLGVTHHSLEDINIMRMLPNMNVLCPADSMEVKLCLKAAIRQKKPCYIRLGKKGEPDLHRTKFDFKVGKVKVVEKGNDVAILSVGNMAGVSIEVSKNLKDEGISTEIVSLHTIKPLDDIYLKFAFENFKLIVVLEEHGMVGGAGSAILEWLYKNKIDTKKLLLKHTPDEFLVAIGNQFEARSHMGLDAINISNSIMEIVK